jgi:hypothetical protein
MNTRPNTVARDISRSDLLLPKGFGVKLFAECVACGVLVAVGFFWGPLSIVAFALNGHAPWFWPAIGGAALVIALLMYWYVRRDVKDFVGSLEES